jgi:hypothetical protein
LHNRSPNSSEPLTLNSLKTHSASQLHPNVSSFADNKMRKSNLSPFSGGGNLNDVSPTRAGTSAGMSGFPVFSQSRPDEPQFRRSEMNTPNKFVNNYRS